MEMDMKDNENPGSLPSPAVADGVPVARVDLFLRNRGFLVRVRSQAYGRARERFRDAAALFPEDGVSPGRDLLRALDALLEELEAVCEYASDAVRGLKRNRVKRYRNDSEHGVLEEEIVLQHFLEEMATLARFLRKRVETDIKVRIYRDRIRRLQSQNPEGGGFLQGVLESLGGLANEEIADLRRIFDLMERRYQMGDRLMEILLEKSRERGELRGANRG